MKTSDLTGLALDWAVATANGDTFTLAHEDWDWYSSSWEYGGPIIEREGLGITQYNNIPERPENRWHCVKYVGGMLLNKPPLQMYGPTPLIAAMRCFVASKMGDEIDLPKELKA